MDLKTDHTLQILEKIGTPLMAAITEGQFRDQMMGSSAIGTTQADAEKMAGLLTRSAELGIHLSGLVDLSGADDEGDAVRLALAALAAPLVANLYRLSGQVPNDVTLDKIKDTLQAALLFSDQFSAGADATARLAGLDRDFFPADDHQIFAQTLMAFVPVINAAAAFSFGQPEKKLVQDVCERLTAQAKAARRDLLPNLSGIEAARADLAFLRTAVQIYAQCHFAEMAKMMAGNDGRTSPSLEPVWQAFDTRMNMLTALAQMIADDDGSYGEASGGSGGRGAAPPKAETSAQQPANTNPGNPMSFFSKGGM